MSAQVLMRYTKKTIAILYICMISCSESEKAPQITKYMIDSIQVIAAVEGLSNDLGFDFQGPVRLQRLPGELQNLDTMDGPLKKLLGELRFPKRFLYTRRMNMSPFGYRSCTFEFDSIFHLVRFGPDSVLHEDTRTFVALEDSTIQKCIDGTVAIVASKMTYGVYESECTCMSDGIVYIATYWVVPEQWRRRTLGGLVSFYVTPEFKVIGMVP